MEVVPEPVVKARLAEAGVRVPAPTGDRLVLKAFGPGIVHKSDVGAVRLGLAADEVEAAKAEMAAVLATHGLAAEGFLVEAMEPTGVEVLVGVVRTPFGLAALAGLGGTWAELLDDVALGLVPVDSHELLRSFKASALLEGARGAEPVDLDALAGVVDGLVEVAQSYGDQYRKDPSQLSENVRNNTEWGLDLTATDIHRALLARTRLHTRVAALFEEIDILATPAVQLPPFPVDWTWPREVAGVPQPDYLGWMRASWYISATVLPAISVPCGFTPDGLPVGIQIVGKYHGDLELLKIANAFEQATNVGTKRPPTVQ